MARLSRIAQGVAVALVVAAALHCGAAAADELPPAPQHRLLLTNILGGSFNAEGVEDQARLGLQSVLYRSDNVAFKDNFVFVGTNPRVNPTAVRVGPSIEIQPLSVFNLKMNVEYIHYFGSFASVEAFSSPLATFDRETRDRLRDTHQTFETNGARISLTPFVQFKLNAIAMRYRFTWEYLAIDLKGKGTVYYEPAYDTLAAGSGSILSHDLDLLYVKDLSAGGFFSRGRLAFGARYTMFKPLFKGRDFAPGDDRSLEHNEMHRVGPLLAATIFNDGATKFHEPTIVAMAQWYAAHPNRTGKEEKQGVPYLVLAFIFQSDLWTSGQ